MSRTKLEAVTLQTSQFSYLWLNESDIKNMLKMVNTGIPQLTWAVALKWWILDTLLIHLSDTRVSWALERQRLRFIWMKLSLHYTLAVERCSSWLPRLLWKQKQSIWTQYMLLCFFIFPMLPGVCISFLCFFSRMYYFGFKDWYLSVAGLT